MSHHPTVQRLSIPLPENRFTNLACSLLFVGLRRKKTGRGQRSTFPSETSRFVLLILVHRGSALLWLVDDRVFLRPLIWCVPTRWSATKLSTKVPPASRVSSPPEEHQIRTRKKHAPEGHHTQPTIPLPRPQPTSWLHLSKVGPADPPERPG